MNGPYENLPNYDLFMAPLEVILKPGKMESVNFAYVTSKYGHKEQKRDDGRRYFDHPKAVAWIYISELGGRDTKAINMMLLHDIVEDASLLSLYRISKNFGKKTALGVRALTKLPKGKETTPAYLERIISAGDRAILAKLLDRLHNIRDLNCLLEKQIEQVEETREFHLKILLPALKKCKPECSQYAEKAEVLFTEALKKADQKIKKASK